MQLNKGHITISYIIIFSKHLTSTSTAMLQGRCSTNLATAYILVSAVTVGVSVSTIVIDSPKCTLPFLKSRATPFFPGRISRLRGARRVATWVHIVSFNCGRIFSLFSQPFFHPVNRQDRSGGKFNG